MDESFYKIEVTNATTVIVSFAGHDRIYGGIPRFEFVHFLEKHFQILVNISMWIRIGILITMESLELVTI